MEGLTEKVTFEQSPRVGEGVNHSRCKKQWSEAQMRSMPDMWEGSKEALGARAG